MLLRIKYNCEWRIQVNYMRAQKMHCISDLSEHTRTKKYFATYQARIAIAGHKPFSAMKRFNRAANQPPVSS